jgi:zinc D-Ala-D-Ala carboxypeptidase
MPTQLTPHFSLEELSSSGKHPEIPNPVSEWVLANLQRVATKLEQARTLWGVPVRITYGYRSNALNQAVGSTDHSAHIPGLEAGSQKSAPTEE